MKSVTEMERKPAQNFVVFCAVRARHIITIFFYVLLTVPLSIYILVINQLDAQNFGFTLSLFHASTCFEHASTCFEHHVPIVRRSKLYYTASGIITTIGVMIPDAV